MSEDKAAQAGQPDPQDQPEPQPPDAEAEASAEAEVEQALDGARASLDEMQQAVESVAQPVDLPEVGQAGSEEAAQGIELLGDVDLDVTIELGRSEMLVEDVLRLGSGSVVELDKLAGDPVDVYVNGRLVARGEVLVLNDNFCIRISEVLANLEEEAEAAARTAATDAADVAADAATNQGG